MTARDTLRGMLDQLALRPGQLDRIRKHWSGDSPVSFLSPKSREALGDRLGKLGVNYPRLVIRSQTDRLQLSGFRHTGDDQPDAQLWDLWRKTGLVALSQLVHVDRALYGNAFVTVWGHGRDPRRPVAIGDSPLTAATDTDPATGEVTRAIRTWGTATSSHAVIFEPDVIRPWSADSPEAPAGSGAWKQAEPIDNPLGIVPVVPFTRRASLDDYDGTSAVADILDLTDAFGKLLHDAMVTSEYFARPRRWATGLEIVEDDNGKPIDPFGEGRFLQSEAPETKFGQLDSARLDGYGDLGALLTQQIGAITGLPSHYLGLHGDQPPNAESVRAAEAQLTSGAYADQRQLDPSWGRVANLLSAISAGDEPELADPEPVWTSPEIRTPAQAADSAAKLHGIGVPLASLLSNPLGYSPTDADSIVRAARGDAIDRAGLDLSRILPRGGSDGTAGALP